ncbi:MAG: ABC transporter permease [Clostridia bacterium]|nr:ABC transporter permease [Clostridia bacterium]
MSEKVVKKHHREPLIHITKRESMAWWKAWSIRGVAILLALAVAGVIIMLVSDLNPVDVYVAMAGGNFNLEDPSQTRMMWVTFQKVAILLCISLAVTPAFKMKFWNCGAEGQTLMGCVAAATFMIYCGDSMQPALLFPLMLLVSMLAGALWGVIPAVFKAYYNTNETLFTLMMNYIAISLVAFLEIVWESPKNSAKVGVINLFTKGGWLPEINGNRYLPVIVTVLLVCILIFIYLKYSKQGYEISVVGESQNTARYVGINVKKVIIRTMAVSGAICGLAGMLLTSGINHTIYPDAVEGQGFTAILVSWLASFNPIAMIFAAFLIIFLQRGAGAIATNFGLDDSLADIVTGIILFFIIGCEFFIRYKINFRHSKKGGVD